MMAELTIRAGKPADYERVKAFYDTMIELMPGTDYDVKWGPEHPSPDFLRASLDAGELYLCTEDGDDSPVIAAFVLNHEDAPGAEAVPWCVTGAAEEIGVLQLLGVLPEHHGKGIATRLMDAAISEARRKQMKSIRLDVLTYNSRAQRLYEKMGFENLGTYTLYFPELGPTDFVIYELDLAKQ